MTVLHGRHPRAGMIHVEEKSQGGGSPGPLRSLLAILIPFRKSKSVFSVTSESWPVPAEACGHGWKESREGGVRGGDLRRKRGGGGVSAWSEQLALGPGTARGAFTTTHISVLAGSQGRPDRAARSPRRAGPSCPPPRPQPGPPAAGRASAGAQVLRVRP